MNTQKGRSRTTKTRTVKPKTEQPKAKTPEVKVTTVDEDLLEIEKQTIELHKLVVTTTRKANGMANVGRLSMYQKSLYRNGRNLGFEIPSKEQIK